MSDSEDNNATYRVVKLKGSDNYAKWELSIASTLLAKGLLDTINVNSPIPSTTSTSSQKKELKTTAKHGQSSSSHSLPLFKLPYPLLLDPSLPQTPNYFGKNSNQHTLLL
jgi:hypothetical protein